MLQGRFGPAGCGFCVVTSEICAVDEGEPKAECVFAEKVRSSISFDESVIREKKR